LFGTTFIVNLINQKDKIMSKKFVIKAQPGVTYECYMGMTDTMGVRARRGRRYYMLMDSFSGNYYFYPVSNKGYAVMIPKKKFASHFCPVNPIECCVE
jgi:hypothetical protein